MSGPVGYDLDRVRRLRRTVVDASGELARLWLDDGAAHDLVVALRRLRAVLDDGWAPTLAAIERHDPLTRPPDRVVRLTARVVGQLSAIPVLRFVAPDGELRVDVALATLTRLIVGASHVDDADTRAAAAAAELLLASLTGDPVALLDLFADPDVVLDLLAWPFVDPALVGEALLAALVTARSDPDLLGSGHEVLRNLATAAQHPLLDTHPLPTPLATALAAGIGLSMPSFAASAEYGDQINLKGPDGRNLGEPLGSYAAMLDLVGLVVRDTEAAAVLVAALAPLTAAAIRGTEHIDLVDVADVALLIVAAAHHERVEDRLDTAATRALIATMADLAGTAAGAAASSAGLGPTTKAVLSTAVRLGGDAAEHGVGDDSASIGDPAARAELVIEIAAYAEFLRDPTAATGREAMLGPLDPATLADTRRGLAAIADDLGSDPAGVDLDRLERRLQDVRVGIVALGGAAIVTALDHGSLRALDRPRAED